MTGTDDRLDEIERKHYAIEWQRCDEDGTPNPADPLPPFCAACTDEEYVGAVEYGDTIDLAADVVPWPCETLELARELRDARAETETLRSDRDHFRRVAMELACPRCMAGPRGACGCYDTDNPLLARTKAAEAELADARAENELAAQDLRVKELELDAAHAHSARLTAELAAERAKVAQVEAVCDAYRANCAPDSTQAQVAEIFRTALAGGEDR